MTSTLNLARVATFAAHRHQPRVLSNAAPSRAVAFENLSRARRHAHSRARAIIERAATEDEDVAEDAADGPGAAPAASASDAADESSSPRRAATSPNCFDDTTAIDDELSHRWIDLDPAGYFLIAVDADAGVIRAAHSSTSSTTTARRAIPSPERSSRATGATHPRRTRRSRGGPRRSCRCASWRSRRGGHRDDARPRELSRSRVSARRDVPQGRVDVRPGLRRRRRTRTGGDVAGARNARVRRAREDRQTGNDEPFAFFVSAFASPLLVPLRLARSSSSTGNNRDTSSCSAPPLVSAPDRTAGTPWSCRRSPP